MADKLDAARTAAVMSTAAAIAASLALIRSGQASAALGGIPIELMELAMAIAQSVSNSDQDLDILIQEIKNLSLQTQGWVPNANDIVASRMDVQALNTARQLPHLVVPDDMEIQLKGWPLNAGTLYLASTDPAARNINSVWPLLPNEAIGYRIKNLNVLYFSGTAVGDWICWTVERRK